MSNRPIYSAGPAEDSYAVTPSDSADLEMINGAWPVLYITTAGNVKHTTAKGRTQTLSLPVGFWLVRTKRVYSTDTTAAGIIAIG